MASPLDPEFMLSRPAPARSTGSKNWPDQTGECNFNSKVNEQQVRSIYSDTRPRDVIAKEYGVTVECVKAIQLGYTWKHLKLTSK